MNVLVYDVAAEKGGALSVLTDFYDEIKRSDNQSQRWIFVLSKASLIETDRIKVLNFPWIKKSWFHRLFFDYFIVRRLVKKHSIDRIFSLQNNTLPLTRIPQIVYLHNILPFVDYKFKFNLDRILWIYQNIIAIWIKKSVKIAKIVIVQSEWVRSLIVSKMNVDSSKVHVVFPSIPNINHQYIRKNDTSNRTLFYPTNPFSYKNNKLIFEAVFKLKQLGFKNLELVVTLTGDENKELSRLKKFAQENKLTVHFVGSISRLNVYEYMTKSIVVFPSLFESFGMPLLEARLIGSPILAPNLPYAREVLDDYVRAKFFNPLFVDSLVDNVKEMLNNENSEAEVNEVNALNQNQSLVNHIIKVL